MRMTEGRRLQRPAGAVSPSSTPHQKYTFNHYNATKNTQPESRPPHLSGMLKKADTAGVCSDSLQTRGVNRVQCARLLFLRCISAADEPAVRACVRAGACVAGNPERRPTHGSRFPLIRRRGPGFVVPLCKACFTLKPGWAKRNRRACTCVRADQKKAILAAVECIKGNDDINKRAIHRTAAFYI